MFRYWRYSRYLIYSDVLLVRPDENLYRRLPAASEREPRIVLGHLALVPLNGIAPLPVEAGDHSHAVNVARGVLGRGEHEAEHVPSLSLRVWGHLLSGAQVQSNRVKCIYMDAPWRKKFGSLRNPRFPGLPVG